MQDARCTATSILHPASSTPVLHHSMLHLQTRESASLNPHPKSSHRLSHQRTGQFLLLASIVLFTFAAGIFQAPSLRQQSNNQEWPTRRELWRSLWRSAAGAGLVTVYPGAPPELAEAYQTQYENLQRHGDWLRRRFLTDQQLPTDSLGYMPLALVGTRESNRLLNHMLAELPIQVLPRGLRFRGVDMTDSTDVLYLTYPNPRNRRMLLTILTGNTDAAILRYQKQIDRRNSRLGDYVLSRNGQVIAFGFFQDHGPHAWEPQAAQAYDLLREQRMTNRTSHFSFIGHGKNISATAIDLLAQREEANLQKLIERLRISPSLEVPRLTIHLWDSLEEKGMFTGDTRLAHTDETRSEVHLAYTENLRGEDFVEETRWFIGKLVGHSQSPALREGLAIALSDRWRGVGYSGWAARLLQTDNTPPLTELLQSKIWAAESDLIRQPLLGSFAEFLLERWGADKFVGAYREWPADGLPAKLPNSDSAQQLLAAWGKYARNVPAISLRHPNVPKLSATDFHRGFCYAHEGYQIYNGYLGSTSQQALAKLSELGVQAISVTPFGYLSAADRPDFLRRSSGARSENDESLVQAKIFAEHLGMRVMLKPHILMMGRDWGWPGAVKMTSVEEWHIFFDRYARWMRHYAMLAEIYNFDSLCIGVELVQATAGHESTWRDMIERWRGLYSGPMLYAANWGEEFENLAFWDALDAIGLNCYYPLSGKEDPTDDELLAGAKQIANRIDAVATKFQKPVVITEIGFTSSARPWLKPHDDDNDGQVNLEAQRRCYEIMFRALWGKSWLAGIYWWKWPTTLEDGRSDDDSFTPHRKPAAQVVARWYGRDLPSASSTGQ